MSDLILLLKPEKAAPSETTLHITFSDQAASQLKAENFRISGSGKGFILGEDSNVVKQYCRASLPKVFLDAANAALELVENPLDLKPLKVSFAQEMVSAGQPSVQLGRVEIFADREVEGYSAFVRAIKTLTC